MSGAPKKNKFPCPHNDGVECWYKERPCATCGWNPQVSKARLDKIRRPTQRKRKPQKIAKIFN